MPSWLINAALVCGLAACSRRAGESGDTDAGRGPLPRLEAGRYVGSDVTITENTCGSLPDRFTVTDADVTWSGEDQFQWAEAEPVLCDVDARNAATCSAYYMSLEFVRAADLEMYVESMPVATSTTSFDIAQPVSVDSCSGFNCDVAAHWIGIEDFPCRLVFHAKYTLASTITDATTTLQLTDTAGNGLAGVEVTINGAAQTADDNGFVTVTSPKGERLHFASQPRGRPGIDLYFYPGDGMSPISRPLWTDDELDALLATFGARYDPSKGMVWLRAIFLDTDGQTYGMDGLTFDVPLDYERAFVPDASQPSFYALGNTTLGTNPSVFFVNVTPGTTRMSFQAPGGYQCRSAWEGPDFTTIDFEVSPGRFTTASIVCTSE